MKNLLLIFLTIVSVNCIAQMGINTETPDASAELHIHSTSKGVILPILTNTQMLAITSPATGLIVYNSSQTAYYYYNGSIWAMIGTVGSSLIDADSDTHVQVEETADEDIIRFDIGNNSGAQYENKVTISSSETVINGDYTIPDGNSLKIGTTPLILPSTSGAKGNVMATDGSGNLSWQEAHAGLGIANGIQTMYFSETNKVEAIGSNTYYTPLIPFSSMTIDTLEVYFGAISGTPSIRFAVFDKDGILLSSSTGSLPSAGLFEDALSSPVTLESAQLYFFAVTDLSNTASTILMNTSASNPLNKSDITSVLDTDMGSPGTVGKAIWIAAH